MDWVKQKMEALTQASHKLAQAMYEEAAKQQQAQAQGAGGLGQTRARGAARAVSGRNLAIFSIQMRGIL